MDLTLDEIMDNWGKPRHYEETYAHRSYVQLFRYASDDPAGLQASLLAHTAEYLKRFMELDNPFQRWRHLHKLLLGLEGYQLRDVDAIMQRELPDTKSPPALRQSRWIPGRQIK